MIASMGFLIRLIALSFLVGENLWVILTRAGAAMLERIFTLFSLPFTPDITQVQLMAIALVVLQEVVYVLCLHALALWVFPRLRASIPEPPSLLNGFISLDPM